jgi:methionyl-tRNA formyltransferase
MKRIVPLVAKQIGYRCLEHLLSVRDMWGVEVPAILFNPKAPYSQEIRDLAKQENISILSALDDLSGVGEIDILFSIQYNQILKLQHLKSARVAINLHMAPLPEYRGCNQFSFAIVDGSTLFGTTLHLMDEGVDSGDIVAERRFPLPEGCFVKELLDLTFAESFTLFKESLGQIIRGEYTPIPQEKYIRSGERSVSFHKRNEIELLKKIDLSWPEEKIKRHIRATSMPGFTGPYIEVGERRFYLVLEQNRL